MAINIKNDRVERLLDDITRLTGEGKTEAIRRALEERRDRLTHARPVDPGQRLRRALEREIWPSLSVELPGRSISKAETEAILGFGADGV